MHAEYLSSDCATARVHVCTFPTCLITQKATNVAKNTPASLGMHRNARDAGNTAGNAETGGENAAQKRRVFAAKTKQTAAGECNEPDRF